MALNNADKKAKWSAYVKAKLEELGTNPTELAERTGIPRKTIFNWTAGDAGVSAENCLPLAAAFGVPASEVLEAGGYELLAAAMDGKELRLVGVPPEPVDPVVKRFLAIPGLAEADAADLIEIHLRRRARLEEADIAAAEARARIDQDSA